MERLQGYFWKKARTNLKFKFIKYELSKNGNIKVILWSQVNHLYYYHWLNDEEKINFVVSPLFKMENK